MPMALLDGVGRLAYAILGNQSTLSVVYPVPVVSSLADPWTGTCMT